jgi:single-strand DNA-binding protein
MPSFNRVTLIGNLTRDPQVKHLPNNTVVAEFGLAMSRRFRTQSGEEREDVCFVDCAAFGKQAEVIQEYCRKGKQLFVEGRLKYDVWDDKAGNGKRSKLSIVVENFQFLGSRDGDGDASHRQKRDDATGELPWRSPEGRRERKPREKVEVPFGDEPKFREADIPF